jgi:hypothetical protein
LRVKIVEAMNFDPGFFKNVGTNLPAMIVMIIAMGWTHATWHRHPRAARWAMLALVWMFITYLLAICWYSFGILFLLHNNLPLDDQTPYLMALSCCEGLGYVFFMLALNAARYPYRPPQYYDQFTEDDDRPRTS